MANRAGLLKRNGRWYFNKAYPKDVWEIAPKATFRKALGTDSLEAAQRARPEAEKLYWAKVDEYRSQLATRQNRPLTEIEAMGIVANWFREEDEERIADLEAKRSPLMDIDAALYELKEEEGRAREEIAERDFGAVMPLAKRLAEEAGAAYEVRSPEFRTLMTVLLRGRRELLRLEIGRLLGDHTVAPEDALIKQLLTASPTPAASSALVHTLADLISGYLGDTQPRWAPSTVKASTAPLNALKELLGEARDVSTITREDGRALFEAIRAIPRNYAKLPALKGLPLSRAIEEGRRRNFPTLAPKTINEVYLNFIGGVFRWGVKEGWLSSDPLSGLTVYDPVADEEKREAFSPAQLNELFRLGRWQKPYDSTEAGNPLRFWGPLIALYQGMRRGEIAQLRVVDVEMVDGVLSFQVRPSSDGQRVKSTAGRRTLPVHPELILMGFPEFVSQQRTAGHKQLFPDQGPNSRGLWGDGLGKWLNRSLTEHSIVGTRLGMHSFRHNFEDALRAAGLHGTPIGQELAGREKTDKVSGSYGSGRYPIAQLKEAIDKIAYPEVDLKHLYKAT